MALEAKDIGYRYDRGEWLFRQASLRIAPGEVVGLSGRSGIGKTTMARLLAGYEPLQEGSVVVDGRALPLTGYAPVQLIPQHPEKAVNPRWRMRDIVAEGWQPDPAWLESIGIRHAWMDRRPGELSGGELQRFCIARALGPGTRYLIADEMTAMMDAITQAQLWQAVLQHAQEREIGVLVVSHEPGLMMRVCHRVIDFARLNVGGAASQ